MPARMNVTRAIVASLVVFIGLPVAAIAVVKPLRSLAPQVVPGMQCPEKDVCIDMVSLLPKAQALYRQGVEQAESSVGPFHQTPRVVFCATPECADRFGLGERSALAVGDVGLVVAPRGWTPYVVAHELIHYRQAESLGNMAMLTKPKWLIEGMAYSLSGDPRQPLTEPFEDWRTKFNVWMTSLGAQTMWEAARQVE